MAAATEHGHEGKSAACKASFGESVGLAPLYLQLSRDTAVVVSA